MSITQFIVKLTSFIYCGSIYLFLGTYLDFFEKNYKLKFSDTYNILCLIGIMIFNLWFQNNHIYTVLFLCFVYYLFLHFTFQFKSKKDIFINFIFFATGYALLLGVYSFIDLFVSEKNEYSALMLNLSILVAGIIFFVIYRKTKVVKFIHSFYRLEVVDFVFILFVISLYYGLSMFLLYVANISQSMVLEFFTFSLNFFFLIIIYGLLYLVYKICIGYAADRQLQELKHREELNYEYYRRREETEKEISYLIHDMKNHLQIIRSNSDQKEMKQYLNEVNDQLENKDLEVYSSRKILQTLLYDKVKRAAELNIHISIKNSDVAFRCFSDFDLVTIFSNMLDNAIEAVNQLEQNRNISLHIRKVKNMIIIHLENPYKGNLMKDENGEYLTTKKEHKGLGIQSMKHVAKKYKGDIAIEQKDGIFNMTIVFPDHDLILDENNPILDNVR